MELQTHTHTFTHSKPFANISFKPTSFYQNQKEVFIPLSNCSISIFDIGKSSFTKFQQNLHEKRINCIKEKNDILITGSNDFTVRLWDRNSGKLIHKFLKPGSQFNVLDLSEHILCAAHTSKLVFWDIRKMKQRAQFNDSFNGQITSLQFDPSNPTCFMGCSVDGMISKFDLKQPNEEQAFTWCTKVLESPSKLQFINNVTLVETTNHYLYLLQDQAVKNKIVVNNFDEPKHILNSKLFYRNNNYEVEYFTWNLQKQLVQKWYNDKIVGYVQDVQDSQIFVALNNDKVMYVSENGQVFIKNIQQQLIKSKHRQNNKQIEMKSSSKSYQTTKQNKTWQKIQEQQPVNENGFILNKPAGFKSKTKKFKPY